MTTHVLRGEAYLAAGDPGTPERSSENFWRAGTMAFEFYYPLAQLGLARALAARHDSANARTAYQDFFRSWKDADPDLPDPETSPGGIREAAVESSISSLMLQRTISGAH